MHSKIKKTSRKFQPFVVELTLESQDDLHAMSAIMNHPILTEDLFDDNLFELLSTEELAFEGGKEASEAAFTKLDKRLSNFQTHP